jgi:hypothetical protein
VRPRGELELLRALSGPDVLGDRADEIADVVELAYLDGRADAGEDMSEPDEERVAAALRCRQAALNALRRARS